MRKRSSGPKPAFVPLRKPHLRPALETYNHYIVRSTAMFLDTPISLKEFKSFVHFGRSPSQSWAVLAGGRFAGYACLASYPYRPLRRTAWISIYLRPERVGQGLGQLALDRILSTARRRRFHLLIALIVEGNRPSIRLFTRNGFVRCGRLKEYGFKKGRHLDLLSFQRIL